MLKTLAALGISTAIVFAPLAAFAQNDATAPAAGAASAATDKMTAPAKDTMKKANKSKKHMTSKMKKPAGDMTPAAPADAPKS
jgi:hypothetical protein